MHFDKITARITKLSYGLNSDFCDPVSFLRLPSSFALRIMLRKILSMACCVPRDALLRQVALNFEFQFECQLFVLLLGAPFSPAFLERILIAIPYMILQVMVAQKVTAGVYKGVTTTELDELAAETAASLTATHPDYALVSNVDMNIC